MKRILITGKNSYIGNSLAEWLNNSEEKYQVDKISVRDYQWKNMDFSVYDSIVHVAGIAHNSSDSKLESLYYRVNRDLTINIARKAKKDGAKQFVFLSSIIVFGTKNECIHKNTEPNPDNFYGDSKLQAEKGISSSQSDTFNVAIVRPPMVYGEGSKGNFPKLVKLANKTKFFPKISNKRSMIYINNLSECLKQIIDGNYKGLYHPQNKEYVNVSKLVQDLGAFSNNKVILVSIFNPIIKIFNGIKLYKKIFGNLYYDENLEIEDFFYQIFDYKKSLKLVANKAYQ